MSAPSVLVVGAGPAGLTLACELYRHGVACRLIEASASPHAQSRATDLHPRTLEALERMGALPAFLAQGRWRRWTSIYNEGERIAQVDLGEADTAHPTMLGIAQSDSEALLARHLGSLGGEIERGVALSALAQDAGGVEVTLTRAGGEVERARFAWVIGCDGAHGEVRKQLGLALEGETLPEDFFLADVVFGEGGPPPDAADLFVSQEGFALTLPLPGERLVRIFGDMEAGAQAQEEAACVARLLRRMGSAAPVERVTWSAHFRVHTRMVARYRVGRAFVAGDAAHLHSPVGAHGMNTSLQDAFNLAWKLAWVCRGWSPEALLDSYEAERLPVARRVLSETQVATRAVMARHSLARALMTAMAGLSMSRHSPLRRQLIAQTLELDVGYKPNPWLREHHSPLLQARIAGHAGEEPCLSAHLDFSRGPAPGQYAPDAPLPGLDERLWERLTGPQAALLLFDGAAHTEDGQKNLFNIANLALQRWSDRLQVAIISPHPGWSQAPCPVLRDPDHALHQRYHALTEALYLVRPDGYVGFRSQPAVAAELFDYLERLWP